MAKSTNLSLLSKLKEFIVGRKSDEITPAEAEKIQKASYILTHSEIKKKFSPTYLSILNGLESNHRQIFEASVYYLIGIAATKPQYSEMILDILTQKKHDKSLNPEFRTCIKQYLQNFLQKNNR